MGLPNYSDVVAASGQLAGVAVKTPFIENVALSQLIEGRVFLKIECLQHTGTFKFRGAYNKISRMDRSLYPGGVVAFGSGNHPQGVALAARMYGVPAVVLMPSDAPAMKIERAAGFGASVQYFDRVRDDREAMAQRLCETSKAMLVPPYNDPLIIAGQGTVGMEIVDTADESALQLDAVYVPCGGGGLLAGVAMTVKSKSPTTDVFAVEPAGFDDLSRSLRSGRQERNETSASTICDALQAVTTGTLTFAIARQNVEAGLIVTDDQVRAAMRFAFRELKVVVEPAGAVALAAIMASAAQLRGKTVVVILSGGNADPSAFSRMLCEQ